MRKINVEKSIVYKFDDRDDLSQCVQLLGEKGYFSCKWNFEHYERGTLAEVMCSAKGYPHPFVREYDGELDCFKYFITEELVVFKEEPKEKKLRPFDSIQEFTDATGCKIGDKITITCVNLGYEDFCLFNGVRRNLETHTTSVMLGSSMYSFKELKDYYLFYKEGKWNPFGIEE